MTPIFKEPPRWSIGSALQQRWIVGPQPGVQRHELRPRDDIDGVDLELCQPSGYRLHVPQGDRAPQLGAPKALRSERDPPRLGLAQLLPSHYADVSRYD